MLPPSNIALVPFPMASTQTDYGSNILSTDSSAVTINNIRPLSPPSPEPSMYTTGKTPPDHTQTSQLVTIIPVPSSTTPQAQAGAAVSQGVASPANPVIMTSFLPSTVLL